MAGPQLNVQKSECMLLKSWRNVCNHIEGIRVTTETVKILGFYLDKNKEQYFEKIRQDKNDMFKMLDSWESFNKSWKKRNNKHVVYFSFKMTIYHHYSFESSGWNH